MQPTFFQILNAFENPIYTTENKEIFRQAVTLPSGKAFAKSISASQLAEMLFEKFQLDIPEKAHKFFISIINTPDKDRYTFVIQELFRKGLIIGENVRDRVQVLEMYFGTRAIKGLLEGQPQLQKIV